MHFKNDFLHDYLQYVEDTESPRVFHIWSALAGVAACLGRRVYLDFGIAPIYPNLYVLLVGPPGARKSTAMNIMKELVRDATSVRFAPSDTAGQRQGLIAAMEGSTSDEEDLQEQIANNNSLTPDVLTVEDIANVHINIDPRDQHTMFVTASEFSTFIGKNNTEMLTFLTRMWDGEDYDYRLKKEMLILSDPLLSLVGCTTPTDIADSMPPEAIGKGFMSRMLLIFGNKKYKEVARPKPLSEDIASKLRARYGEIYYQFDGAMQESDEAKEYADNLYGYTADIVDPRFVYYAERRQTHLIKLTMCLAAARGSKRIEIFDYQEAQTILKATEVYMPDALGEYGMSPIAAAKQKMLDFIMAAKSPIPASVLWAVMHRDMTQRDFGPALTDLVNANKVMLVTTDSGPAYVARTEKEEQSTELLHALTKDNEDGT